MSIHKIPKCTVLILLISLIFLGGCSSSSDTYSDYDESGPIEVPDDTVVTSDNWECTDDCSGHEAGYEWAEDNGITDPDDCDGNSDSFIEGCEAYANEASIEEEYEEEYYDYPTHRL